ncbi:MAG: acylneuraminate cytidylyltransferase family protein [Bacteroidetes bacterium]|nr:MAG: acylneuraminate cytidylyltransferase family protein [Bacteroidota bacterium]
MRILGLIPARGGSKGIPGKNSKMLAGKPLIAYTIEAALRCSSLARVMVSTDDEGLAAISRSYGAAVPFLRPAALATDSSPTIDTVVHTLRYYQEIGEAYEAVCLLQPTTPFRTAQDIERAIQHFQEAKTDSLVSVREVPHAYNPHWVFLADSDTKTLRIATGDAQIITRRQELPKAYYRDGAIYLTKAKVVLEQASLYGRSIAYVVSESPHAVNLDTPEDWAKAEALVSNVRS